MGGGRRHLQGLLTTEKRSGLRKLSALLMKSPNFEIACVGFKVRRELESNCNDNDIERSADYLCAQCVRICNDVTHEVFTPLQQEIRWESAVGRERKRLVFEWLNRKCKGLPAVDQECSSSSQLQGGTCEVMSKEGVCLQHEEDAGADIGTTEMSFYQVAAEDSSKHAQKEAKRQSSGLSRDATDQHGIIESQLEVLRQCQVSVLF